MKILVLALMLTACVPVAEEVAEPEVTATADAVTADEVVCTDYLGDLPGVGFLSLDTEDVSAFGDDAAARLSALADQAESTPLVDALQAEAEMWDGDEDFHDGPLVLTLCTGLLGSVRANELLED